jgi:EAL and modified HD-GYP domain-containing signal transduction protein
MAPASFPLVELRSVANAQNEWVALLVDAIGGPVDSAFLQAVFGPPDLLEAVAPLDCIVRLHDPVVLDPPALNVLLASRILLAVSASALARDGVARRLAELQMQGYRVLIDGPLPDGVAPPLALRTVARDCSIDAPRAHALPALFGPHLAYQVDSVASYRECEQAGFAWFSGDYVLENALADDDDGTSRRRMLTMLALLARDADSQELELQLKQDPALSYHLLKLVNSAAFTGGVHDHQLPAGDQPHRPAPAAALAATAAVRAPESGRPAEPAAAAGGAARRGAGRPVQEGRLRPRRAGPGLHDRRVLAARPPVPHADGRAAARAASAGRRRSGAAGREGKLGQRLRLLEAERPDGAMLQGAGVDAEAWWQSQLHAYHWAIQVAAMSRMPAAAPVDFVGSSAAVCEAVVKLRGDALHAELGRIAAALLASPQGMLRAPGAPACAAAPALQLDQGLTQLVHAGGDCIGHYEVSGRAYSLEDRASSKAWRC